MELGPKSLMFCFLSLLTIQSCLMIKSHSKSIIKRLPGYSGDLPFKLETGYIGIGENEEVQLFYYFVESTKNANEDPLILYLPGGPGASGLLSLLCEIGPLMFNLDGGFDNIRLESNPYSWTQMANIIFMDTTPGSGFSYAETKEGWISSDTIIATQADEFIRKFLIDHPKFLRNPLYVAGISYMGIIVPKITLDIYEGNEHGDQPSLNIQGYILCSPLTHKFNDFNSRFEYAHGMALISHDIYKSGVANCAGNYVDIDLQNSFCANSLQSYVECISRINYNNILQAWCDKSDPTTDCDDAFIKAINIWANLEAVQEAINIRPGKIGKWDVYSEIMHYDQGKSDTDLYSYDIFSSVSYHETLSNKSCRSLIFSGDHDMTFPYVGVIEWITSLNLGLEVPWKPFYVDGQVGGYKMKYTGKDYSLTFATVKGAGHIVPSYNPKETFVLIQTWLSSQTYTTNSHRNMSPQSKTGKTLADPLIHNVRERPKRSRAILSKYVE